MKRKSSSKNPKKKSTDLRREYDFVYSKAKPNRFAASASPDAVAVLLDSDVAAVFKNSKPVNAVLRALMKAMPRASRTGHS